MLPPRSEYPKPTKTCMALAEIRNFVEVDDALSTGGQPSEQQLAEVAAAGFGVVVNLGLLDPRYCLRDEAGTVAGLGLAYHHIPVDFQKPEIANYRAFENVMRAARGQRVFVHCAANYRVSCFVALYAERQLGWDRARAEAHVRSVWEPNETWAAFLEQARSGAR
jgi:protein tyrosine phosphatase (PTP) superfamily phosphohydrolase (DUF442 family)